ncbi:M28 family peptidase [Thalassotalea litorea]|uniref:M28 family peptidase n=1 Tax=Thalassotalea litorea TaxID=2020715 RepID=A0A5R9IHS6_9GAMM|nr:M28 family peptidase [Thalassotalea litorea]TLU64119.1 M28 family peptidase [Thalassotalea litorea]
MKRTYQTTFGALALIVAQSLSTVSAAEISIEQVSADVVALAGDNTLGRAADGEGIKLAEKYIADEFKAAGLQPFFGESYFQGFSLYHYQPRPFQIEINGVALSETQAFAVGSAKNIDWQMADSNIIRIGAQQDFRATLGQLNSSGESALVLVDKAHEQLFNGFANYLKSGTKSLTEKNGNALVFALSNEQDIKSLVVSGGFEQKQVTLNNVAGVLKGKTRANEYVVFSAHHDHIGHQDGTDSTEDTIYNGANDDASGVSAVLNLARYYQQFADRERSILFITFTAEEMGLLGSEHFGTTIDAEEMVAMFNIEMIGKASEFGPGKMWMTGMERSNLGQLLNTNLPQQLKDENYRIEADPYPDFQLFYRSDNASLARLGVPAHSISSTQISNDRDYHKVSDEISTLDFNQMTDIIKVLSQVSQPIVNAEQTPERIQPLPARSQGHFF